MKTASNFAVMAVIFIFGYSAFAGEWVQDVAHTTLGFSARHMVVASVAGKFKDFTVNVTSDKQDFSDAKITVRIKTASISTENDMRDNHLRSNDFFAATEYPEIVFVSTAMQLLGNGKYKVTGNLTIRGTTRKISLDAEFGGIVKDPWGNTKAGFSLTGTLNRFDFGLKWNNAIEAGGLVVGETIKLVCDVELQKKS